MPIQLIIDEKRGETNVTVVTPPRRKTINSLAFYSKLEPLITKFKEDVRKSISACCDRGK